MNSNMCYPTFGWYKLKVTALLPFCVIFKSLNKNYKIYNSIISDFELCENAANIKLKVSTTTKARTLEFFFIIKKQLK